MPSPSPSNASTNSTTSLVSEGKKSVNSGAAKFGEYYPLLTLFKFQLRLSLRLDNQRIIDFKARPAFCRNADEQQQQQEGAQAVAGFTDLRRTLAVSKTLPPKLNPAIIFENFSELEESETSKMKSSGENLFSSRASFLMAPEVKLDYNSDDGSVSRAKIELRR